MREVTSKISICTIVLWNKDEQAMFQEGGLWYTGLEDAERIDNGPLLFYRTFFPYDLDSRRVNNLSPAPLLDLSV